MTLLQIVNKILRRLREDEVTATTDNAYATLVADFVSDVHNEVMEAHDWSVRRKTIEWDCVVSQRSYDLSATVATTGDVISGGTVTNQNSYPIVDECGAQLWLYATSSSTEPLLQMQLLRGETEEKWYQEDRDNEQQPSLVAIRGNGDGLTASMYPTPDDTYRARMRCYVPETTLLSDGTNDSTDIEIPSRPIYLGALYLALNERGEEMGEPGNVAEQRYMFALGAAIEADMAADGRTNRYEFYRD